MGRELKRVPLDFDWPVGTVWEGFINPYSDKEEPCPSCSYFPGETPLGHAPGYEILRRLWYHHLHSAFFVVRAIPLYIGQPKGLIDFACEILNSGRGWNTQIDEGDVQALIENGRLPDFTRRPRTQEHHDILDRLAEEGKPAYWLTESNGYVPTPLEVNAWSKNGFGHDAINAMVCCTARAARYGVAAECLSCGGRATVPDPELEKLIDGWKRREPPLGPGFQLWSTTGDGHPLSPVFEDIETLSSWAESNATTFGYERATVTEWRVMLESGFIYHKEGNAIFI